VTCSGRSNVDVDSDGVVGQLGFMDVILERDSLEVVQAIKREESQGSRYGLLQ
jgi:hypothetical protein